MKSYKPTSKSRRHMTTIAYRGVITHSEPHKPLSGGFKRSVGRNSQGRLTTRHKGGGHKRLYRDVDFSYSKTGIPAKVLSVEYDPNRSGFISLAGYPDGEKKYLLTPKGVGVGDTLEYGMNAEIKPGNALPLKNIPVGTRVYNVEIKPKGGGKIARAAGNFVEVVALDAGYTHLKMPSSEIRKVQAECMATIGEVSNDENRLVNIGKAGRSRWLGIRPTVRGTAQNPVDHPYGGGEGRQGRGLRRAKTRWGKPVGKGQKSRRAKKYSNFLIVSRRKVGKSR